MLIARKPLRYYRKKRSGFLAISTLPCILQAIWEADPVEGTVRVSKLDVTDVYHRGTLRSSQVVIFIYVVS